MNSQTFLLPCLWVLIKGKYLLSYSSVAPSEVSTLAAKLPPSDPLLELARRSKHRAVHRALCRAPTQRMYAYAM